MAKPNRIRHIVRLRQMLRTWSTKSSPPHRSPAPDVPAGHVAVCVGTSRRRFVVRATHLNHPVFRRLLSQVAEEYGFSSNAGPLAIPCEESVFEEILRLVSRGGDSVNSDFQRCGRNEGAEYFGGESRPLIARV